MEKREEGEENALEDQFYEQHRPFLRQANHRFALAYGLGGLAVLGLSVSVLVAAWWFGFVANLSTGLIVISTALLGLWVLRHWIDRAAIREVDVLRQYCAVNEVDATELMEYFAVQAVFPYLDVVSKRLSLPTAVDPNHHSAAEPLVESVEENHDE